MKLTKNFTLAEMIASDLAKQLQIKDQFNPPEEIVESLTRLCVEILQPLRDSVKTPITVNSGWRHKKLNYEVGGSARSDHLLGLAADITITPELNRWLILAALFLDLPFKQLIIEYGTLERPIWIHISLGLPDVEPKKEILRITNEGVKRLTKRQVLEFYTGINKTI